MNLEKEAEEIQSFATQHNLPYEDVETFAHVIAAINTLAEQTTWERKTELTAMNIVYQICDLLETPVDTRQKHNDTMIDFTKNLLTQLLSQQREAERERIWGIIVDEFEELMLSFDPDEKGQKVLNTQERIAQAIRKGDTEEVCQHCGGDIKIRNPKGFCDHLYHPEYCKECSAIREGGKG